MKSIGLFEAKTKLSEICQKVAETGEVYTITRRGKPVAKIEPIPEPQKGSTIWDAVEEHRRKHGPPEEDFELPEREMSKPRDFLD